nr:cyclin-dependent kinase A-2-like [Penaeus vannamei]
MDAYTVIGRIGEGAHGVVVRAKHNLTGKTVALKKIPLRRLDQGMPTTALREIKALREINSQHRTNTRHVQDSQRLNRSYRNPHATKSIESVLPNVIKIMLHDYVFLSSFVIQQRHWEK